MPQHNWAKIALAVYASTTAACASVPPAKMVALPQLVLPPEVERPCGLAVLEGRGELADLEVAYMRRGEQLLACDAARALAVEILNKERALSRNTSR